MIKIASIIVLALLGITNIYSQTDTTQQSRYDELSLKELLNVKIVSVSKKSELLFEAPLSASVITKEDIQRVGCTSIMEALRLVPGMIIREQSNGNYDIHLRGMDNVPPNAPFELTSNTTTLVMIDNRPIYSYLRGGTFWETLPVDLNDVEKIEVIRGPAAALYGPNAVNGVINIITRQAAKDGLYVVMNTRQGSFNTFINNASIGYRSKKWAMIVSGNYQDRDRTQTSYYEFTRDRWLERPEFFINFLLDTVRNVNEQFPDPGKSMKKYAGNIFLNYNATEKIRFNISAGAQHSMAQKVLTENQITPLTPNASDSRYVDFRATVNQLTAQISYNEGTQIKKYGTGNKYDFNTLDGSVEYYFQKRNLSIKPGLSYRSAIYDDTKYSDITNKTGIFNARGEITTESGSLRGEYNMLDHKLRLITGIMASKFNYPDTTYLSYEFAATYKLNKRHLVRAVYSRAPRSAAIYDTYVDLVLSKFPIGYQKTFRLDVLGNKDLKLLTADMFEVGYRGNISPLLNIDVEFFDIQAKNFNALVYNQSYTVITGADTLEVRPVIAMNLPLKLHQQGITVSLSYTSKKILIKPFVTIQQTKMKNYAPYINTPEVAPYNIYSGMGTKTIFKGTPAVFGGATINYKPEEKFNFNLNAYYYSAQTYFHVTNIVFNDGIRGIDHIVTKLVLNAHVSYEAIKGLTISCSGKNILNNKKREFFRTDEVPAMWLAGLHYEF